MLNIGQKQSGEFDKWTKYNAKAGRWYMKGDNGEIEVQNPVFVADLDNIKTGWFYFREGAAPEIVFDPDLNTEAQKPVKTYVDANGKTRDCFARGFDLRLFSKASFGGVVVMNGTSGHLNNSINELYIQYAKEKPSNPGALPVVAYTGCTPMKDKFGTNYKPNFKIEKWVPRPAEFDATKGQAVANQAQPETPKAASASEF